MLRNIGLLFLLAIGSQALIVTVMEVTGLPYRMAGVATFAIFLVAMIVFVLWFVIRLSLASARASSAQRNARRLLAEQKKMLPEFRKIAENITDAQARAEALAGISFLEKASMSQLLDDQHANTHQTSDEHHGT